MSKKSKTSEFGKGFVYNLILFAKHWGQVFGYLRTYKTSRLSSEGALSLWFNGSSDHFYELEIPPQFKNKKIGKLAKWLQEKALYWGHGFKKEPTQKDFDEFFKKLEELARLIDKELGVEPVKAEWN